MKEDQVEWVNLTRDKVYKLLAEIPPDGASFAKTVKNILKREEYWNSWKNDGCPAFKRPAPESQVDGEDVKKPKKIKHRIGDTIKDAQALGKYNLGKLV